MSLDRRNGNGEAQVGTGVLERNRRVSMSEEKRPDPEVLETPKRRRFTAEYKARIVREAESCTEQGEIGALLRREALYSSQLSKWRELYSKGAAEALRDNKRGRKRKRTPEQEENERLRKENEKLKHRLYQAETIIDCQKKLSRLLGIGLKTGERTESD
jgi:transposase